MILINWSQKTIKYLVIWLTHSTSDLYKKHYDTLNTKIKEDLSNWSTPILNLCAIIYMLKCPFYLYYCIYLCRYQLKSQPDYSRIGTDRSPDLFGTEGSHGLNIACYPSVWREVVCPYITLKTLFILPK